ncbi:MAG: tRNA 2-thiouridine(34) synthase MnmA [Acidimicrobiaceae bacterium]|nr:tRNA 2-thiouridine(34) synthase MnmA [Acidimicrobiaceae bacterium]
MKVLVAMSGGVDSSVAAALLVEQGHEVVGATMKLWGGSSDSGCCSVSDVEDARRVASQIGIDHYVFNFTEEFEEKVVKFYVNSHQNGLTPNPCIECNRHLKFSTFIERAKTLGFDFVATGHHARVLKSNGVARLTRGTDLAKDQSYVLSMLQNGQLEYLMLPVGEITKDRVREIAREMSLRTALKPDSQDVCFITSSTGRDGFLSKRIELHSGELYDSSTGDRAGAVDSIELVTVGQRKGLGTLGDGAARYVVSVDVPARKAFLGRQSDLMVNTIAFHSLTVSHEPIDEGELVEVQGSAHGRTSRAVFFRDCVKFEEPHRKVAPGQTLAFYRNDVVIGSAIAC